MTLIQLNLRSVAIGLVLAFLVSNCAASRSQYHTATVAATSIHDAIAAMQDSADALHEAGLVNDAQYVEINRRLMPLLETGDSMTVAILNWPAGEPVPDGLRAIIMQVDVLTRAVLDVLPQGIAQSTLLERVIAVQRLVVQVLLEGL